MKGDGTWITTIPMPASRTRVLEKTLTNSPVKNPVPSTTCQLIAPNKQGKKGKHEIYRTDSRRRAP